MTEWKDGSCWKKHTSCHGLENEESSLPPHWIPLGKETAFRADVVVLQEASMVREESLGISGGVGGRKGRAGPEYVLRIHCGRMEDEK